LWPFLCLLLASVSVICVSSWSLALRNALYIRLWTKLRFAFFVTQTFSMEVKADELS
jgi:hypothetical protein